MPLYAVLFLAVLVLLAVVVVAPFALVYFVWSRFCDLTESLIDTLPWAPKGRKKRVSKGFGLATLRDVFPKLPNGTNAKNFKEKSSSSTSGT